MFHFNRNYQDPAICIKLSCSSIQDWQDTLAIIVQVQTKPMQNLVGNNMYTKQMRGDEKLDNYNGWAMKQCAT